MRKKLKTRPSRDRIKDRTSIHDRPESVNDRTIAGDWEADLIICKRAKPVLVVHEKKTRLTLAVRLDGKTADQTISKMLEIFENVPAQLRSSITLDNDTTFAKHMLLTQQLSIKTYFCDVYGSFDSAPTERTGPYERCPLIGWIQSST